MPQALIGNGMQAEMGGVEVPALARSTAARSTAGSCIIAQCGVLTFDLSEARTLNPTPI